MIWLQIGPGASLQMCYCQSFARITPSQHRFRPSRRREAPNGLFGSILSSQFIDCCRHPVLCFISNARLYIRNKSSAKVAAMHWFSSCCWADLHTFTYSSASITFFCSKWRSSYCLLSTDGVPNGISSLLLISLWVQIESWRTVPERHKISSLYKNSFYFRITGDWFHRDPFLIISHCLGLI